MPSAVQTNTLLRRRRTQTSSRLGESAGLGCALAVSLLLALGGILFTLAYIQVSQDLPSLDRLPALLEPPHALLLQPTHILDRTGEQILYTLEPSTAEPPQFLSIASLADADSQGVFPGELISATLASADPDFWHHSGYSLSTLFFSPAPGDVEAVHSPTLAQQLVSDLLLEAEPPSFRRSVREILLAAQVTTRFGKAQVLEWYLNSAAYSAAASRAAASSATEGARLRPAIYGANAASQFYFDKPASQLSLAEAAFLAAAAQDLTLDPWKDHKLATRQRDIVIGKMLSHSMIDAARAAQARAEPLVLRPLNPASTSLAPAFAHLALHQIEDTIPLPALLRGGYRIITTLDTDLQAQAACAAGVQVDRLSSLQSITPAGQDCPAAQLLPTLAASLGSPTGTLAAEVVILDPHSGQILALVGEPQPLLVPAALPGHAPGTLLTPFIYLAAFSKGISPATLTWDIPSAQASVQAGDLAGDQPNSNLQNFDGQFRGPMRLRTALANDYLPPAENLLAQLSPETVWRVAQEMGVTSFASQTPQVGLYQVFEHSKVSLLEAVQAFGVLANQGILVGRETHHFQASGRAIGSLEPGVVLRVEDAYAQETVLDWDSGSNRTGSSQPAQDTPAAAQLPVAKPVIGSQLAYLLTDVLSDETARWPSQGHPNALEIGRPAAVKVGRTFSGYDNWTVGGTPQLTIGVWVGNPEGAASPIQVHPGAAAALWHALVQYAHRDQAVQTWQTPAGINRLRVCSLSGMLPTPNCPETVTEVFVSGTEPDHEDTLFRKLFINRDTGAQATIFTPPELVQEKVFLIAPPEASSWASQSGFETPPDTFDSIPIARASIPGVEITSPAMLSTVSGEMDILGTAAGDDFDFFRVQVGPGLNPQAWLQLGEDSSQPVEDGVLAAWDTSGLDGIFAIQLLVVRKDQQVETTAVLVTVDNQPLEIQIEYPVENATIGRPGEWITFRATLPASESLEKVEFFVDGQRIATRLVAPFDIPWQAVKGRHQLSVKATDQAGNQSEASVSFLVP